MVKTLLLEQNCSWVFKNPRASLKWLVSHFKRKVQGRSNYKVVGVNKDVEYELKLSVSKYKCKSAKKLIKEHMGGVI